MKTVFIGIALGILACYTVEAYKQTRAEIASHHAYTRAVELQLADLKARLEILENIGVEIHVSTHGDAVALTATEVEQ